MERKADGTVLLMDATYSLAALHRPEEGEPQGEIALLSFDPASAKYRFDLFFADGNHEVGSGRLDAGVLHLVTTVPGAGFRRITIDLSDPGVYHETGERSPDGSAWQPYSDVILKREGAPGR